MTPDKKVIFLKPCKLAVVSAVGPYRISERDAWQELFEWLDSGNHHEPNGLGFGLSYDMSVGQSDNICKYIAGVRVPKTWKESDCENMRLHAFAGGPYLMRTNVATYQQMAGVLSEIEEQWTPKSGVYFDQTRPVVSLYRHDPRTTPFAQQQADVCLPLEIERRMMPRD